MLYFLLTWVRLPDRLCMMLFPRRQILRGALLLLPKSLSLYFLYLDGIAVLVSAADFAVYVFPPRAQNTHIVLSIKRV